MKHLISETFPHKLMDNTNFLFHLMEKLNVSKKKKKTFYLRVTDLKQCQQKTLGTIQFRKCGV